jgi:hypothetical protein
MALGRVHGHLDIAASEASLGRHDLVGLHGSRGGSRCSRGGWSDRRSRRLRILGNHLQVIDQEARLHVRQFDSKVGLEPALEVGDLHALGDPLTGGCLLLG